MRITRRRLIATTGALATAMPAAARGDSPAIVWPDVVQAGRGQSVAWHAAGDDDRTNAFIAWTAERMKMLHEVTLRQQRIKDAAEAVSLIASDKASGRTSGGSVDLIWLQGHHFREMKEQGLLYGPILDALPRASMIDRLRKPSTMIDCTLPIAGLEVPWRMSRLVFVHDAAKLADPPKSMVAMLAWSATSPGRLTHPILRHPLGAAFLRQALVEFAPDPAALQSAATDATYDETTATLWAWYAALRPTLWHQGKEFPKSGGAQRTLLNDGRIALMVSLNPSEAATEIANRALPDTVRAYTLTAGTIGHCSFNAIPFNAANKEAALLTLDFLLSPEAQARAMDGRMLGSPTVLALDRLPEPDRKLFDGLPRPPGTLTDAELGQAQLEPHPSWTTRIVAEWEKRVRL